jgi:hypothetical protein
MTAKRNGARQTSDIPSPLNSASFLVSQRVALETARFWARRMHAYADQMEALAKCTSPDDLVKAQRGFMERMQQDYAEESAALTQLVSAPTRGEDQAEA